MPNPTVSVVIPTYQRRHLLTATLEGALRQEDVEVEAIVVDDASPRNHPRGLEILDDPRVTFVELERNSGQSFARNTGIARAGGDWIAFLDDDDLWAPRKLASQLAAAEAAGAPFAYGGAVIVDERRAVDRIEEAPTPEAFAEAILLRDPIPAGASNVVARAEVVRATGGFDTDLHHQSDWDMWLRLADHGAPAATDDIVVAYFKHGQNFSLRGLDGILEEFDRFALKHAAAGHSIDASGFLRWVAWNERIAGRRGRAAATYVRAARAARDPTDLARAATAFMGERAIRRLRPFPPPAAAREPAWLALYR